MPARVQIVVPCYNEARRLQVQPFLQFAAAKPDVKLLFVDDGSTDATPAILADLASGGGAGISVLTLPQNAGKAQAVQRGAIEALGQQPEIVGYWDADLSTPLSVIQDFLDLLDSHPEIDIVMGARVKLLGRHVTRNAARHYCGRLFATAASLALRVGVYDTQCGAKLFRVNEPVRLAFTEPFQSRWAMDVEILARYISLTGRSSANSRICEVPLQTWTEMPGSNLRARHAVRAMWDLARIWRRSSRR